MLSANSLRGLKNALKSKHKSLRALDLHGNARLGDAGVEALAKSIGLAALESLDLGDCGFTARGMKELAIAINSAHIINSLQRLDLSANPLRKEGGAMVGACVQNLLVLLDFIWGIGSFDSP